MAQKIFLTEYTKDGRVFSGPRITAANMSEAQSIAQGHNPPLKVIGQLAGEQ